MSIPTVSRSISVTVTSTASTPGDASTALAISRSVGRAIDLSTSRVSLRMFTQASSLKELLIVVISGIVKRDGALSRTRHELMHEGRSALAKLLNGAGCSDSTARE